MVDPLVVHRIGAAQGTERHRVHLVLGALVDQCTLLPRERHVFQVALHEVLADLRADRFQAVAEMRHHRIVAAQRAALLQQIPGPQRHHRGGQADAPVPGRPDRGPPQAYREHQDGEQVDNIPVHGFPRLQLPPSLPRRPSAGFTGDHQPRCAARPISRRRQAPPVPTGPGSGLRPSP
ncbi:hypothetical protein G6F59_016393 [Rhizopus arrhizus]|nr:hypothetical protein G6F59_016393 [Rhizopus arrhizus]